METLQRLAVATKQESVEDLIRAAGEVGRELATLCNAAQSSSELALADAAAELNEVLAGKIILQVPRVGMRYDASIMKSERPPALVVMIRGWAVIDSRGRVMQRADVS